LTSTSVSSEGIGRIAYNGRPPPTEEGAGDALSAELGLSIALLISTSFFGEEIGGTTYTGGALTDTIEEGAEDALAAVRSITGIDVFYW
jgi:hypothetical protein